uniref:Uncharacterized protein n=1 Tax=Aegilops tauschii subsp. strangulata TaxID=200361 RepID=A0A453QQ80_AEGTS
HIATVLSGPARSVGGGYVSAYSAVQFTSRRARTLPGPNPLQAGPQARDQASSLHLLRPQERKRRERERDRRRGKSREAKERKAHFIASVPQHPHADDAMIPNLSALENHF